MRGTTACALVALLAGMVPGQVAAQEKKSKPEGFTFGPGARLRHGDLRLDLTGYAQGDFRSFRDWQPAFGDPDEGVLRSETSELRRLRIGIDGKWKRLEFQFQADPRREQSTVVKDAYLDLEITRALHVRGGSFKPPVSREFLTSASRTDFMERSMLATQLAPDRDWGVMLHGQPWKPVEYAVGYFEGDGRRRRSQAQGTVAGRVVVSLPADADLGASFSQGDVVADPEEDPEARSKGLLGQGPSGFVYHARPFVNGRRRRLGFEAGLSPGPVGLRAEWLEAREERRGQGSVFDDLPDHVGRGWAVAGTWLLTGEKKKNAIEPRNPVPRGVGALELGVRYEELRFDDDGPDTGFAGAGDRARNIRPAADRVLTAGLSWWPRQWLRAMGNVLFETFDDPLLAPEVGRKGRYVTLVGRLQLRIP